ncbi:hypothetical protein BHM03_00019929 [Ensete ventricosum]|nr:hypothetical protein BHM03_00019929 [Ensete ventricosum]
MGAQDFLLALEGFATSSECRLVGQKPRWSPHVGVDFWSLVELQLPELYCNVSRGVDYPRSGDLIRLASMDRASTLRRERETWLRRGMQWRWAATYSLLPTPTSIACATPFLFSQSRRPTMQRKKIFIDALRGRGEHKEHSPVVQPDPHVRTIPDPAMIRKACAGCIFQL